MFRRKKISDERIIQERRKHNSEALGILFVGLLIDVFYRSVIARQDIGEYWDIAVLFYGICFYLAIRNISKGILFFEERRMILKKTVPSALVAAIVIQITTKWINPLTIGCRYAGWRGGIFFGLWGRVLSDVLSVGKSG